METNMIKMGPIGERTFYKETEWDDKGNNIISHIIVSCNKSRVTSIQFGYVNNGDLVMSKVYGSSSQVGCSTRIVRLNHESEFVTGIQAETYDGDITSLTFLTNQQKYEVVHFTLQPQYPQDYSKIELLSGILNRREFRGFFGTHNSDKLITIGFYVRLELSDVKTIKEEKV